MKKRYVLGEGRPWFGGIGNDIESVGISKDGLVSPLKRLSKKDMREIMDYDGPRVRLMLEIVK